MENSEHTINHLIWKCLARHTRLGNFIIASSLHKYPENSFGSSLWCRCCCWRDCWGRCSREASCCCYGDHCVGLAFYYPRLMTVALIKKNIVMCVTGALSIQGRILEEKVMLILKGRSGRLVVSVLNFYFGNLSSNPVGSLNFQY